MGRPGHHSVMKTLFCIVSWHREGRDLSFWDGTAFGASARAEFFESRKDAFASLKNARSSHARMPDAAEFFKPNILNVEAYNKKFGKSIGPKPKPNLKTVKTSLDWKTGILTRTEC